MTLEIIARDTCPKCGGTGYVTCDELRARGVVIYSCYDSDCIECPEPRVLATFADAAELIEAIEEAMCVAAWDQDHSDAIRAALGVSDDHA